MRVPRIFVDIELAEKTTIDLPAPAFQHLCKVLRLKSEHPIKLFNGSGGQFNATLVDVEKRSAKAQVGQFETLQSESPIKVTIGQSLSRGERMDYAIQKAVEAGVHAIQPLFSERCEVKIQENRIDKRVQHWQQVAISAAEQSGREHIPTVHPPIDLQDWLGECNQSLKLTLHHHSPTPLKDFSAPESGHIALLIGPEGGLSEEEVKQSFNQGFKPIKLGPRVLRTETAPVVALSLLHYLWGDV